MVNQHVDSSLQCEMCNSYLILLCCKCVYDISMTVIHRMKGVSIYNNMKDILICARQCWYSEMPVKWWKHKQDESRKQFQPQLPFALLLCSNEFGQCL